MASLIKLPAVAADASEGILHQWLKKEGERVAVGEALAEVETEKAIVEINAEQAGVLGRIVVQAGPASVPVNSVIGVLLAEGEDASAIDRALAQNAVDVGAVEPAQNAAGLSAVAPAPQAAATPPSAPASDSPLPIPGGRLFASPLARRLAAQWHVDLLGITGTGPHGRIVRRDVEAARDRATTAPAAATATAKPAVSTPAVSTPAVSTPSAGRPAARRVPHTGMRRAIARRMTDSKLHVPHFYLTVDCSMDALLDLRSQANHGGAARLSVNDFIVRAAALALREVPEVNASWHEDAIEYHAGADISVAVATDGGLATPIVRDADLKSLPAIAGEIADLARRAKANRLKPEEFSGGSLTVSNLGMYGIRQFAAIINPPQAAILAVGAAERRPIVDEHGQLAAATAMTVTLSADHRVVDGAVGARWLAAFRSLIENPVRILL